MNYEVNEGTLAVMPEGDEKTKILEDKNEYIISQKPFAVMDHSCKYFGSSYDGRKEGAKAMLGINYKVPIIIEETKNIIMFPTTSPQDESCIWISLNQLKDFEESEYNTTIITFENGVKLEVPVSKRSIENQISRSTRLESTSRKRK